MFGFMRSLLVKVLIGVLAFALVKGMTGGSVDVSGIWEALTEVSDTAKNNVPEVARAVLEPVIDAPLDGGGDVAKKGDESTPVPN